MSLSSGLRTLVVLALVASPSVAPWSAAAAPLLSTVATTGLSGAVSDQSGARLPNATVQIVELGRSTHTNASGVFRFDAVPAGRYTLGVDIAGYASIRTPISIPSTEALALVLDTDLRFREEVGVTAAPWALSPMETAQQIDLVDARRARSENMASIGEALAHVPGVAFIPTGNALGTPVIRGISEHRIRVLSDGVGLNHQQNSWRHSPNVEPGFAERLEVIRGPASVLYGPDAMGGVINLIHAPLPYAADGRALLRGELAPGFAASSQEWTGRGRLEGAVGGFGWRLDALRRRGDDIRTPGRTLDNTDFEQTNASITAGYVGGFGSVRVRWHHWEDETGFYRPEGFRLDLGDDLLAVDAHVATRAGIIELVAGHQTNVRTAFPAGLGGQPGVDLELVTRTGRFGLQHNAIGPLRGRFAVEYTSVENTALAGELVPDYEDGNLAWMVFEEARFGRLPSARHDRLILSAALRGDSQSRDARPFASWELPPTVTRSYGSLTGSAGAVLRLSRQVAVAGSVGRGWRPPNAFELFARGVHGGVSAFQVGNPDLVEESNLNSEAALRFEHQTLKGSVVLYRNSFDNYIYLVDSGEVQEGLPVFVHHQADATIEGVEISAEAAPTTWLRLSAAGATVRTRNEQTDRRLPQTPPDRLHATIELRRARLGSLADGRLALEVVAVEEGVVSGPDEPFGTPTAAYAVAHARGSISVPFGRRDIDVTVAVHNLFDTEYTDFLWSYKSFALNPGRDVRVSALLRF